MAGMVILLATSKMIGFLYEGQQESPDAKMRSLVPGKRTQPKWS